MIAANELRIGNWVEANGPAMQIVSIGPYDVEMEFAPSEADPFTEYMDKLRGIPLTPEILLDCGFGHNEMNKPETLNINWFCVKPCDKTIHGQIFKAGMRTSHDVELFHNTELLYLHQLQNLYFSLTNKELNYKP